METTLLWETNSSSCSRRDSGICALTCADRFSLFTMIKKTPRGTRPALHLGGNSALHGGGGRRDRRWQLPQGNSCPVDPFHRYWGLLDNLLGHFRAGASFHSLPRFDGARFHLELLGEARNPDLGNVFR